MKKWLIAGIISVGLLAFGPVLADGYYGYSSQTQYSGYSGQYPNTPYPASQTYYPAPAYNPYAQVTPTNPFYINSLNYEAQGGYYNGQVGNSGYYGNGGGYYYPQGQYVDRTNWNHPQYSYSKSTTTSTSITAYAQPAPTYHPVTVTVTQTKPEHHSFYRSFADGYNRIFSNVRQVVVTIFD